MLNDQFMMRYGLLLFILFSSISLSAQTFWSDQPESGWASTRSAQRTVTPIAYRTIAISASNQQETFLRLREPDTIAFPLPDQGSKKFILSEKSNFHPELAARYPTIRSFTGYDPANPRHQIALSVGPLGVHAVYQTDLGEVYLDPYQQNDRERHLVYYTHDHLLPEELRERGLHCGVHDIMQDHPHSAPYLPGHRLRSSTSGVSRYQYRIAIATTGEYAQANGGTIESTLNAINVALTRVNFVFNQEMAIRFQLVAENDQLIFLDPEQDPYDNDNLGALLGQNQTTINTILGTEAYDLGHVFAGPCGSGTVGLAALRGVCNTSRKARATSCQIGINDRFYIGVVAHEIGHQFNASHTFNNCPTNSDQTEPSSAFEPGGGSTIMAYAGACGTQSFATSNDPYFHVHSLQQMTQYSREGDGQTCAEITPTENTLPEVDLSAIPSATIPILTPFKLTASARDSSSENLTYCWEQYDLDPATSALGNPSGNDPAFRSFTPTLSPTRYFPRLSDVLIGLEPRTEVLPNYARDLTFRCTVRDNDLEAGGVDWDQIQLRVTDQAGPFRVVAPNRNLDYTAGREYEIRWEVANTDRAPVNCHFVHVLLSLDQGATIFDTLAINTPNDGSVFVRFPDTTTTRGRIFIEAADNVFYDVSDNDFVILPATDTTFSFRPEPAGVPLSCQPEMVSIQLTTTAYNGYDQPLDLALLNPAPGLSADFEPPVVAPGDTALLRVFSDAPGRNTYSLEVAAIAGTDTLVRELLVVTQSNNFGDLAARQPANGTSGILLSTDLQWSPTPDAETYQVQLSTNPAFPAEGLTEQAMGLSDTIYPAQSLLKDNELYFWRVRPFNVCGSGPWTDIQAFHTASTLCDGNEAQDLPINIAGTGRPTISSTITVNQTGTISDVNIPFIKANYQPVNSLRLTLISPSGTEVILFDQNCGNTVNLSIGFDEDAPNAIQCPPDDGIVFRPVESLAAFIGEPTQGKWTLQISVEEPGFGASGGLEEWRLEFCTQANPQPPVRIGTDTLLVPPGKTNTILPNNLLAEDPDNTSEDLRYTVIQAPVNGTLTAYGSVLEAGDEFTQRAIETFDLLYTHNGSPTETDLITFAIEDGTGGFLSPALLPVIIDEDAVVKTELLTAEEAGLSLFPVPTQNHLWISWYRPRLSPERVQIMDAQGRVHFSGKIPAGFRQMQIDLPDLVSGAYWLRLIGPDATVSHPFTVVR